MSNELLDNLLSLEEILEADFEFNPVIGDDILDIGGSLLIVGATEVGKSYFVEQLALSLASGTPFLGRWSVEREYQVLLLQAEIGHRRFQERIRKLASNFEPSTIQSSLFLGSVTGLKFDSTDALVDVRQTLRMMDTEVLILDPLLPFHSGDENSSKDMQRLFTSFRELQEQA